MSNATYRKINLSGAISDANFGSLPATRVGDPTSDEMVGRVAYLAEGINGPNTFDVSRANYGYVAQYQRIVLPEAMREKIAETTKAYLDQGVAIADQDSSVSISRVSLPDVIFIAYLNYARLVQGKVASTAAFYIAMYRARLVQLGYMYTTKADRKVTNDEVDWSSDIANPHDEAMGELQAATSADVTPYKATYTTLDTDGKRIAHMATQLPDGKFKAFIRAMVSEEWASIIMDVVLKADQWAAMMYLVFRQHGHHYLAEYEHKYEVMTKATTLGKHASYPGHENMMRIAVHSFGLRIFHQKYWILREAGKLSETLVDRGDVAPSSTAIVATCAAAFDSMHSLPVWEKLYAVSKNQIDELYKQAAKLKGRNAEDAIKYHKNARLFGAEPHKLDSSAAEALASLAKGFIDAAGKESDLSRQKALDKRAKQNPIMSAVITDIIVNMAERLSNDPDALNRLAASANEKPAIDGSSDGQAQRQIEGASGSQ